MQTEQDLVSLGRRVGMGVIIIGVGVILTGLGRLVPHLIVVSLTEGTDILSAIAPLAFIFGVVVDTGIVVIGSGIIVIGRGLRK
jgi:hypothetical protein